MTGFLDATDLEITRVLSAIRAGADAPHVDPALVRLIEQRLRQLAAGRMRGERADHTLSTTELVNEAYLRIAGPDRDWENRALFFGAAVEAMRRILVEHARARSTEKRGGGVQRVTFEDLRIAHAEPDTDLLALDEAMQSLEAEDPRLAKVVRLRYFGGFTIAEVADLLGTSPATVKRDWSYARARLLTLMTQ